GAPTGQKLSEPIIELYYKDDALGDPMINRWHIRAFSLGTDEEMDVIEKQALIINTLLVEFFGGIGLTLVDYKLEFGRSPEGILLADEISPDGCRLWDTNSGEILDKDRFRQDLGNLTQSYQEVSRRVSSTVK
ncbi:MAG: phosphoribosylaminoimidazolesuccinocarboxamide synthase, partial [Nitrospinota bacterium]|nr:phosphoribosylaminoimidazolesuccinocarboxamide synthase [Nitrospinota bacterium]